VRGWLTVPPLPLHVTVVGERTLVKMVFDRTDAIADGFVALDVPGATPK
jgi:hypothetical protein